MYEDIDILDIDSIFIDNNLIDIREKYEHNLGSISGSLNIPFKHLMINPDDYLDKDRIYYLFCQTGSSSRRLCIFLNSNGYHTIDLVGGYSRYENGR